MSNNANDMVGERVKALQYPLTMLNWVCINLFRQLRQMMQYMWLKVELSNIYYLEVNGY